jgi:anti-sigma B factor antagonist
MLESPLRGAGPSRVIQRKEPGLVVEGRPPREASSGREDPIADIQRGEGRIVVRLVGELDLYNAHVVRETLLGCCGESPERLVVDLSGVTFVDSTALGVLIEARTRLPNRRGFLLAAPALETRRALEISGLDRHFAVHESLDDALTASL